MVDAADSSVVIAVDIVGVVVPAVFGCRAADVAGDGAVAPAAEEKSLPFLDSSDIIPYTVVKGGVRE